MHVFACGRGERVCAPPVERKGEKISGVRNAGKPCRVLPPERRKKIPLRLQVWSLGAESVCAPPVERKGEKISGVRNVKKPRAGWGGDLGKH